MTNKILARAYQKAKEEGRLCSNCGWIITKKDWAQGLRMCAGCTSAMRGVNVNYGHVQAKQEKEDITGESL